MVLFELRHCLILAERLEVAIDFGKCEICKTGRINARRVRDCSIGVRENEERVE